MSYRKLVKLKKGLELWERAKKIIPGGNQLLSKRSEMFLPGRWPSYYAKAKGVKVWDLDGKEYIDMSIMGIGSCILGYADPDVNRAVKYAIDNASMTSLNSPEEVELAELLCELHPWAKMVRYARTGGEAAAIAVRIARGFTGKDKVAFCGYHGWHDWYLSSNLADDKNLDGHLLPGLHPLGVPRGLAGTAFPFRYNHIEELEEIVRKHDIGTIIMEPSRHEGPQDNFLGRVRKIASDIKAVLIFDEISSGWRSNIGGIHLLYKVYPDIAIFGKAISNGYPMTAVIGKKNIMEIAQRSFISSTYWTERIGPTAAIATIKKMKRESVPDHVDKIGKLIGEGWQSLAAKHKLDIEVMGPNPFINFAFHYPDANTLKTLFTQELLKRGFLASPKVYVSYAHKENHIKTYMKAVDEVFGFIKTAIQQKKVKSFLHGPPAHSDFRRLT